MKTVDDIINELVEREGGFTDHPSDKGGSTCWGITEAVARAFGYTGAMKDMPRSVAKLIYLKRYWIEPGFADILPLAPVVAMELLDTGVNMGQATAAKFLQRALNLLNDRGKRFPDLTVDGRIGSMTIAALRAYLTFRGREGEGVLLTMLDAQQSVRYMEIAEATESQEDFEYGWQRTRVGQARVGA